MRVQLALRGALASRIAGGRASIEVPDQATVGALLEQMELPPHCVAVINGSAVRGSATLHEGDQVQIFAPQAGG
jgi:sulfur carrier protein ThiS